MTPTIITEPERTNEFKQGYKEGYQAGKSALKAELKALIATLPEKQVFTETSATYSRL